MSAATINASIKLAVANIDQFAASATFNGVNLLSSTTPVGGNSTLNVVSNTSGALITASSTDSSNAAAIVTQSDSAGLGLGSLTVSQNSENLAFTNASTPTAGDTISLTNGTKTWTFELETTGTPPAFATAASATQSNTGVNILTTDSNTAVMQKISTALQSQGFGASIGSNGSLGITGNGVTSGTATVTGGATLTNTTATAAIATVQAAIAQLNTNSSYIGSKSNQVTGMSSFAASLQSSVSAGIGALTDANMAAESAQLQSLQTKQSLGIQALSIANQQPGSIMTLFR
jgi:flagellin